MALKVNSVNVLLPINAAIPCGLVVSELISNALKHAFPNNRNGQILVDLANEPGGMALLSVTDDGVGFAEAFDIEASPTLGLQLVTMLVDQLGGALDIKRSNPTRFTIRFPLNKEEAVP